MRPAIYIARAVIAFLLVSFFPCVNAQAPTVPKPAPKNQDPLNRDSPQSSVYNFLEACRAKDYSRAWRYLDLRDLPENKRADEGRQLAKQLEEVLDRDPRFDVASLSRDPDGERNDGLARDREVVDTFNVGGRSQQLLLERSTLRSGLDVWLFAPESVDLIPKVAATASASPIEKYLPAQLVNWKMMDTPLWRWIAMLLIAILLAGFSRWISRLALLIADALVTRTKVRLDKQYLHSFTAPLQLLVPAVLFRAAIPTLGLGALLRLGLERLCGLLVIAGITWLCIRIIDAFAAGLRAMLLARKSSFPYSTLPLTSRIVKLTILVFAFTALLSDWGYNTSTILAGLGVGGIAIALAAQKTIENLFGGVSVISDAPVKVGDYCKFGSNSGTVEDIGLRSTRVRTDSRTLVTVPNGVFASMTIENLSRTDKTLFHLTLNLRRDTTPDQVRTILDEIGATLRRNPKIEAGAMPVRFVGIGAYSLDVEIYVYVLTVDGNEFLKFQEGLLLTILDEVAAAGTALALPTQASVDYSLALHSGSERGEPVHDGRR
ncbi:MAG TPA: mechanosensitive ion channel domain-containing protein [Bryobacteraceae bacterium]|nr:mechanosensitive ion channel domain-containing protein [Bryobacteraceae bacterium]